MHLLIVQLHMPTSSQHVLSDTPHDHLWRQLSPACMSAERGNRKVLPPYLHVRDTQQKFSLLSPADVVKDLTDSQGNNARLVLCASHCVSFATACLTISKHGAVEATNNLLDQRLCCLLIDLLSGPTLAKNIV